MDNLLVQSGVVGIFAILVIREILSFFGKSSDSNFPTWLQQQVQQAVAQISKDMQSQTEAMKDIRESLDEINKTLFGVSVEYEHIRGKINDMTNNIHRVLDERSKRRGNGN